MPALSTLPTAAELDRQAHRLYAVARRARTIAYILANPQATGDGVAYASARIPRAMSAAHRLLAFPGVADHEETPYALSFLKAAVGQLNAPSTRLLRIAATARQAAARADDADDDLRVVVFHEIEERCRFLVDAAAVEPVLGRRGWTDRERQASDALQEQAARWGLTEAAERAAARARCAAGIRCSEPTCLAYGAVKVTYLVDSWLCADCIKAANTRLNPEGHAPDPVRPVPGGTPESGRYTVTLYNAIGKGARSVKCSTPQRAQFIAETVRPFNNTGYTIHVSAPTPN
ncbi:hypothetical protein [Streptomyces tropicalis]|uniref:Uncharacterized protein n=1 Tax=Streptomyces tropicalis TaxID=3034234 RepID=A0ABT6AF25_9ACTN|nr:hypothetical protein [Streptomyces tropicalis]MDF3303254.1 hypothetical protein [Streptomyces tropicalis]